MKNILTLVFIITSNAAYSYFCSEPSRPYIPDGYYSERYEMESARGDVQYYISDVNEYINCLNEEIIRIRSEANDVISELDSAISAFNNR